MKKSLILIFILFSAIVNGQQYRWYTLPNAPFTESRSEDIFFINEFTGWIARSADSTGGQLPNIYKTTDGGNSWINQFAPEVGYPRCIGFANENTGWIGTYFGDTTGIFKTTDGGNTWFKQIAVPRSDSVGVCGIHVLNEQIVRACGKWNRPAKFYKTDDGGKNWITKDMSAYATRLIDCYFTSPDSGFVVGGIGAPLSSGKGVVLFTSDGGENWVTRFTTQNIAQWGWKISFPTKDTGYVSLEKSGSVGGLVYFLKTTNGGEHWQELRFNNTYLDEEGVGFINGNTGWIGGWWFNTHRTTNGGYTWQFDPWGYNVNRFRFFGDTLGYAVGQTVYKYMRDTTIGITQISNEIPERPEMSQNFPNPFNPSTTIKFRVVDFEDTKLTIFDVLGREISVLVNERLYPGYYEYTFDASDLQSGVYFYRIETLRYTETKRMVLVK
jgi:photosystem II stability/assembly factor-like uncharacterized protein